jgi:hypothetical protein
MRAGMSAAEYHRWMALYLVEAKEAKDAQQT